MKLVLIDSQDLLVREEIYLKEVFIKNIKKLISFCRKEEIEVIYIRHDDGIETELTKGKPGFEIYSEFSPKPHEKVIDKAYNSAFKNTELLNYLRSNEEDTLIIAGLQTDYCIDASVKCAFDYGFKVIIPDHCHSTVDNKFMTSEESYHYYHHYMWDNRYATCLSLEKLMSNIMKVSKNNE